MYIALSRIFISQPRRVVALLTSSLLYSNDASLVSQDFYSKQVQDTSNSKLIGISVCYICALIADLSGLPWIAGQWKQSVLKMMSLMTELSMSTGSTRLHAKSIVEYLLYNACVVSMALWGWIFLKFYPQRIVRKTETNQIWIVSSKSIDGAMLKIWVL